MNKFTKSSCVLLTNKEKLENRNTTCFWKESKTCEKTMDKFKNIYTLKSRKKKTNKYTMTTEQDSKVWTLSTNWPTDSSNPNQNHNWLLGYKSINLFQNGNMYKESRTAKTFLKKTKFGWLVLGHQDFLKKKKKKKNRGHEGQAWGQRTEQNAELSSRPVQTRSLWLRDQDKREGKRPRQEWRTCGRHCAPRGRSESRATRLKHSASPP